MKSNQITVLHNSEGGIVRFVYNYQNGISFFRFNTNDRVELLDYENEEEKVYVIKKYEKKKSPKFELEI